MEIKFFDDKLERFIDGLEESTIAKVLHVSKSIACDRPPFAFWAASENAA